MRNKPVRDQTLNSLLSVVGSLLGVIAISIICPLNSSIAQDASPRQVEENQPSSDIVQKSFDTLAPSPELQRWVHPPERTPSPLAVSPDGRLVIVHAGCEVILYEIATAKRLYAWTTRIRSAEFSKDSRWLVLVDYPNDIVLWDTKLQKEMHRIRSQTNSKRFQHQVISAVNHDASRLAIDNYEQLFSDQLPAAVLIYDTQSGKLLSSLDMPDKLAIRTLAFVQNRQQILIGYQRAAYIQHQLRETISGKIIVQTTPGDSVFIDPQGERIAAIPLPGDHMLRPYPERVESTRVKLYNTKTGKVERVFKDLAIPRDLTFDPSGEKLFVALETKLIEWDIHSGEVTWEKPATDKPYSTVLYSPDGKRRFATVESPSGIDEDVDHFLRGWNVSTGKRLNTRDLSFASYNGSERVVFLPEENQFIDLATTFAVRDSITGEAFQPLPLYRRAIHVAVFSPDGKQFLAGDLLTNRVTGKQHKWNYEGHHYAFVEAGKTLFFDGQYSQLLLVNAKTGNREWSFPFQGVIASAISQDAQRIVVSHRIRISRNRPEDFGITLLTRSDLKHPVTLPGKATHLAMPPEGDRFIGVTEKGIEEFDFQNAKSLRVLFSTPGRTLCLSYSNEGRFIVAGGIKGHQLSYNRFARNDEGWAVLWDSKTEKTIALSGHSDPVTAAAFVSNSERCATGSQDRTIRLWSTKDAQLLHVYRGHLGTIHQLAFDASGDLLLSAAEDGAALWNANQFDQPPESLPDFEVE